MELRHLRYFVAVAEAQSFRKAAETLFVAQPALSKQIHDLEKEIAVVLLRRTSQGVILTEAGQVFLAEARSTLAQAQKTVEITQERANTTQRQIRIGYKSAMMATIVPRVLQRYGACFPTIGVVTHELMTNDQMQALYDHTIDVAFGLTPDTCAHIAHKTIAIDPFVILLPQTHPLRDHSRVDLTTLAHEAFILPPRQMAPLYHSVQDRLFAWAGFQPRVVQEASTTRSIAGLVSAGVGLSVIMQQHQAEVAQSNILVRALAEDAPQLEFSVMWREDDENPVLHAFLEIVHAVVEEKNTLV